MKKCLIGIFIGFCLSFAVGAHAEVINMIGKTVQGTFPLTINNQRMEYDTVVLDGTTYAPVRMIAEATGYIVRFDSVTGVKLVKKVASTKESVMKSIEVLNNAITRNANGINEQLKEIEILKNQVQTESAATNIKRVETNIERLKQDTINCQEQISKLNEILADIAAQEAELYPAPTQ